MTSSDKMRIVLLMQYYDPEPIYKGQKFAEAVAAGGYDVEVVTGFPNYPGGKVYDGYKIRPWVKKQINDITVTRVAIYPSHDSSKLGRVLNYVSFFLSALLYLTFVSKQSSVIYAYHPPLTVGLAAAVASFFRRTPFVVDIHDLWPETLPATGMLSNPRLLRLIDRWCNWLYRRADHIILHSHGFFKILQQKGVPKEKMTTVLGWTNEDAPDPIQVPHPTPLDNIDGLKILYAGNMGPAQALGSVIEAASILQNEGVKDKITFCFLGAGLALDGLKHQAETLNLKNVVFLPRVSPQEVGVYLRAADCLLVHLKDSPLFSITMPSKTQAYMLAARPILMAAKGEVVALVDNAAAGLSALPENPRSIADAAIAFGKMPEPERVRMGQRAQAYYWQHLSMAHGMQKFIAILDQLHR